MFPISISLFPNQFLGNPIPDFYVDSVNGNDSNSGNTVDRAFKTIAKVATKLLNGKTIGLVKGSTWKEELDILYDNITVIAVGSGADPIFDCTDTISAAAWSKTAGKFYVYQFTGSNNFVSGRNIFQSVWENTTRLVRVTSTSSCDSTPGSYYCISDNNATPIIYVHATGDGNPATNGKTYSYATRSCGIDSYGKSGSVINGIKVKKPLARDGGIRAGVNSTIRNCTVEDGNMRSFYGRAGTDFYSCVASGCYYNSSSTLFVLNENVPAGQTTLFKDCTVILPTYNSAVTGFYGLYNTTGRFGTITFENCNVTNCGVGYSFAGTSTLKFTNCSATNCKYDFQNADTSMTCEITGGTFSSNVAACGCLNDISFATTWKFDGCTIHKDDIQNAIFYSNKASSIRVTNCNITADKAVATLQTAFTATASGTSIYSHNNNFYAPRLADGPYCYNLSANVSLDSDYNNFARSNYWFMISGTNYATLALYKTGTGQDSHSTVG